MATTTMFSKTVTDVNGAQHLLAATYDDSGSGTFALTVDNLAVTAFVCAAADIAALRVGLTTTAGTTKLQSDTFFNIIATMGSAYATIQQPASGAALGAGPVSIVGDLRSALSVGSFIGQILAATTPATTLSALVKQPRGGGA